VGASFARHRAFLGRPTVLEGAQVASGGMMESFRVPGGNFGTTFFSLLAFAVGRSQPIRA
jgi:hypothetical protein